MKPLKGRKEKRGRGGCQGGEDEKEEGKEEE